MQIIDKKIGEIKPYEKNPRKNDNAVDAVASSISQFGFKNPIVIDGNNVIICGHTRYKAAQKLGLDVVPCVVADDLTEEQIKAYRLADNKVAELAEWDIDLLGEELDGIFDIDMSDFGFDLSEEEEETEIIEDELPEEVEPVAKMGDIWQLGRHRLMCGDSTNAENVAQLVGGDLIDLLITDPPYNVNYGNVRDVSEAVKLHRRTDGLIIQNDNMDDASFRKFLVDAFSNANSVMRDGAVFYIWHSGTEGYNFIGSCNDIGWKVREILIWNKNVLAMGRQDYQWKHEPCLYGWKEGAAHNWYNDRKQTTVIDMAKPTKSELHPTMKPIPLFDYQIRNSSKVGDNVLDLFGGSGTTLMACEQNNRNAYLMEFDPHYVDVIIARWEQFTGQKAVLVNG